MFQLKTPLLLGKGGVVKFWLERTHVRCYDYFLRRNSRSDALPKAINASVPGSGTVTKYRLKPLPKPPGIEADTPNIEAPGVAGVPPPPEYPKPTEDVPKKPSAENTPDVISFATVDQEFPMEADQPTSINCN